MLPDFPCILSTIFSPFIINYAKKHTDTDPTMHFGSTIRNLGIFTKRMFETDSSIMQYYRILYPYFDRKFIFDSYSCRKNKGTHRAIHRFRAFERKVSRNNTRTAWVLKGDIKRFFASIDHAMLLHILKRHIEDAETIGLLREVIESFYARENSPIGLPLGNLTSQLLINVYMNEFDQFLKRTLKVHYYIRYADDFVILHERKEYLTGLLPKISEFLETTLKLSLHTNKVFIKALTSGVDFLGWVHFPHHRVLRTSTKRRMFAKLRQHHSYASLASYRGMLSHVNTDKLLLRVYEQYAAKLSK